MDNTLTFENFRDEWQKEVIQGSPTRNELSRRFIRKLVSQWRDLGETTDDILFEPDGDDSGIDLIYFEKNESHENSGDTLYLFQSKFGSRSINPEVIFKDGQKVVSEIEVAINTGATRTFPKKLQVIIEEINSSQFSHITFVIATSNPLTKTEIKSIDDLRSIGQRRLGTRFEIQAISLETIYLSLIDETANKTPRLQIPIKVNVAPSGDNLLVGSVTLPDLFEFMKTYRAQTGDLDLLYEKNVRRFLGIRGRINKQIRTTLQETPSQFGLYNNGITIVVKDFQPDKQKVYVLNDPYIVNGCQTTRTIWEVFSQKIDIHQNGADAEILAWKEDAKNGIVIVKIVRVGSTGEELLQNITRYTNSQNAVSEKDFITLDKDFQILQDEMASKYDFFLEIQRGGWDSQQTLQNLNVQTRQFVKHANAFDLLKVYGAGWLRQAGIAVGRNRAFSPGGAIYRNIMKGDEDDRAFNSDDLYAAYVLEQASIEFEFGRAAKKPSRRITKFLFYLVTIDLLRDVFIRSNIPISNSKITEGILKLQKPEHKDAFGDLLESSIAVIDEYLTQGEEDSVFNEPEFKKRFNGDLNGYLKWDDLGLPEASPVFINLLAIHKRTMGRGQPSPRSEIELALK
ncbi:MAG: AIPR family protein [Chloroflexi bacterium]|nr:AIPR family protein [Chloroflexota bacterium]